MSDDPLRPGGALEGPLFRRFLRRLSDVREPEPGERIGAWKIVRELGRGGSGVVFLAERADGAYSQQAALKWLRADRPVPGGRAVLRRERELLASLDHPSIARLIDGGETDDGMRWFAMDLVSGRTIDRAAPEMSREDRLALVRTLCEAVQHAHRRGLVHGDIKPSNVLVDSRNRPRLVDFGISRLKGDGVGSSYGMTPDYASPEQRRGDPLTTASDIWQLGHLLDDLLGDPGLEPDLRAIIRRATAERPDDRYASASAMAADIDDWMANRPVAAHSGGPGYRLAKLVRRNRALSVVTVIAAAVILAGGAGMTWQLAEERDRARAEANRAQTALASTERALARAESLRRFLLDLLQATRPDRPRDQLPSTEDILARGTERALDPDSAPPHERVGMLLALGGVHLSRSQYDRARPLLEEALALARGGHSLPPADLARALEHKARLMIAAGDALETAENLLIEAEAQLTEPIEDWNTLARIRVTRTWVPRHRGQHDRALALVEGLWQRLPSPDALSVDTRAGLLDSLAALHGAVGHLEEAARYRSLANDAFRRAQGPEGQGYVVSLANSVGLEHTLGHFDEAERRARRAIALYDRIYDKPIDYRATVRRSLARILLTTGRIDEAFQELEAASREHAAMMERPPDRWPLRFSARGHFHSRIGDAEAAVADFRRARTLIREQQGWPQRLLTTIDVLLAGALCRQGRGDAGLALLGEVGDAEGLRARPRTAARLSEARATCALAEGRAGDALPAIDRALSLEDAPGDLVNTADRLLLKARILQALGRREEAAGVLARADGAFVDLGLDDHPVRNRVKSFGSSPD